MIQQCLTDAVENNRFEPRISIVKKSTGNWCTAKKCEWCHNVSHTHSDAEWKQLKTQLVIVRQPESTYPISSTLLEKEAMTGTKRDSTVISLQYHPSLGTYKVKWLTGAWEKSIKDRKNDDSSAVLNAKHRKDHNSCPKACNDENIQWANFVSEQIGHCSPEYRRRILNCQLEGCCSTIPPQSSLFTTRTW